MRKIIPVAIVAMLAMLGYQRYQRNQLAAEEAASEESEYEEESLQPEAEEPRASKPESRTSYTCDGRQHCSEMHSCQEARWFLQHCSGMKMDGDHDGIPCEDQLCGH